MDSNPISFRKKNKSWTKKCSWSKSKTKLWMESSN